MPYISIGIYPRGEKKCKMRSRKKSFSKGNEAGTDKSKQRAGKEKLLGEETGERGEHREKENSQCCNFEMELALMFNAYNISHSARSNEIIVIKKAKLYLRSFESGTNAMRKKNLNENSSTAIE